MEAPEDSVALIGCLSSGEAGPDLDGALHRDPAPAREASQTLLERRGQAKSGSLDATGRAKSTSIVSEVQDVVYRRGVVDVGDAATHQERAKLVIIMVGLPGRGKTYLCNKLMRYLNWCDTACRVRRSQRAPVAPKERPGRERALPPPARCTLPLPAEQIQEGSACSQAAACPCNALPGVPAELLLLARSRRNKLVP